MQRSHVLTAVTWPRQRLCVSENALPISLLMAGIFFVFSTVLTSAIVLILTHGALMGICYLEPYAIDLLRARRIPRTRRRFKNGGNIYGA